MGLLARRRAAAAEEKPFAITVDDRIRASARAVLPFKLTAGQRSALKDIVDDLQRSGADEPPAAGRRRRRQDDRRADCGARRDGERPAGRVHGADRDPGRAALPQHLAAAAAVPVPRRAADRLAPRRRNAASSSRKSKPARCTWSSARTRWSRATCGSSSSGWWSSTSSTASASSSARRCARRDCGPTCW